MDAFAAGQLSRGLDRIHSVIYFVPDANERFGAIGMQGRMHYFASRAAPMGRVTAQVVAATFYNFNPDLVAKAIPAAWELASPEEVTRVRYQIVDAALPRVLGDRLAASSELAGGAELLRRTAEAIPNADGRPLYAGHAELPWPDTTHVQLWHAITLLREYRGDGHIAALVAHGLSGLESLITHTATGIGFTVEFARRLRGWSQEQWDAAAEGLRVRGLLDEIGGLTSAGEEMRSRVEDLTDQLAFAPWQTLSHEQASQLVGLSALIRDAVSEAGVFPSGAFGPRFGDHR